MEYDLNLNLDEINCFGPKSDPSKFGHVGQHGQRLKLKQKGETRTGNHIFCGCVRVRVREEKKRRAKGFFPRSTEFRRLKFVEPKTKVHHIDEGYVWVPKTRDFSKDPNEVS